jgi:rubrerythrin
MQTQLEIHKQPRSKALDAAIKALELLHGCDFLKAYGAKMTTKEKREKYIKTLKLMLNGMKEEYETEQDPLEKEIEKQNIEAVEFAIASIKVDLAYDMMCENAGKQ